MIGMFAEPGDTVLALVGRHLVDAADDRGTAVADEQPGAAPPWSRSARWSRRAPGRRAAARAWRCRCPSAPCPRPSPAASPAERSVAATYWTVTVLLAIVWIGICRPLWIEACWLLSVATFGAERMLIRPSLSAACRATSSVKVLSTLPSRRLMTPASPPPGTLTSPETVPLFGKIRPVVLPFAALADAVEAPVDAELAGEPLGGLDDPRLDHDLRLGCVEPVDDRDRRCPCRPAAP